MKQHKQLVINLLHKNVAADVGSLTLCTFTPDIKAVSPVVRDTSDHLITSTDARASCCSCALNSSFFFS